MPKDIAKKVHDIIKHHQEVGEPVILTFKVVIGDNGGVRGSELNIGKKLK